LILSLSVVILEVSLISALMATGDAAPTLMRDTLYSIIMIVTGAENPCLWIGAGVADIDMFRGNFSIKDKLNEKIALTEATVSEL
ncbi:hypothetical protein MJM28_30140, partial [Salmonella enterica subsp. enterica serovar Montevideo]|nr:hypothetical protein [Salmonella enterica subsp. enterica serovar Montevideo]